MSREKELVKNTIILFIGIFFTKVIQYFLLPLYTNYLSTDEYGTFELFSTIITLLLPIVYLQIEQGCFRFLIDRRRKIEESKKVISTSFFFITLINIIVIIIFCFISPLIKNEYKWLVLINLVINSFFALFTQISRGLGKNKLYSISGVVNAITTIIFNILFLVFLKLKVDGMLYGTIIGYIFCIIYLFKKLNLNKFISRKKVDKDILKRIINYSIPMIPNSISWWIFSSSDRIIVSAMIGLSATGILSVAYKLSNIIIVVYNVFNMSLTESIALNINDSDVDEYFNNIYNTIGNFFVSLGTIIIAFLPFIFHILINKNYNSAYGLIPIAIVATEFQVFVGMLGTIYVAKNSTRSIAITSICAAIINFIIDIILIPYIGIYAAVVSTIISYFVLYVYRYVDVNKKYFRVKGNNNLILNFIINIIIILPLSYIEDNMIRLIMILLSIIGTLLLNKNCLHFLKNLLKERNFK